MRISLQVMKTRREKAKKAGEGRPVIFAASDREW
jgi:hypothetical protein